MFEQYQIYDSPYQEVQSPIETSQLNEKSASDKMAIKKVLTEQFMVLSHKSPNQAQLNHCHRVISDCQVEGCILEIFLALVQQFAASNQQTLTKLVITQIFSYMKRQSSFGFEQRHDRTNITCQFLNFFLNSKVPYPFKKMLQNSFMQFIYVSQHLRLRQQVVRFISDQFSNIFSSTESTLNQLDQYNKLSLPVCIFVPSSQIINEKSQIIALNLIHVLKCVFQGGNLQIELMKEILSNCFTVYYSMMLQAVTSVLAAVKDKQESEFINKVEQCVRFSQLTLLMFSKIQTGKYPLLKERFLHTKEFFRLLLMSISLSPQFKAFQAVQKVLPQSSVLGVQLNREQITAQVLGTINCLCLEDNLLGNLKAIDQTNKKTFFNLIMIKKHALQILIKSTKIFGKKKDQAALRYPYLHSLIFLLWIKVKDCLMIKSQEYLKSVQTSPSGRLSQINKQIQDLLSASVKFLSQVVRIPSFYKIAGQYQNEIIFGLCFPWLISRKQQHDRFQAEDYLFFREDILNKQNMSYIENNIGCLLQSYLDNIDGAITSILVNCTNLISFHLTQNSAFLDSVSAQLKNAWFIDFYSIERQIQSALTLIGIQSYLSLSRNDIVLNLEKWIQSNHSFFLQVNNDYRITTQFLMMYSYYADNFYANFIQGICSLQARKMHRQVLKFCCFIMKESYDYEANNFKSKKTQILYLEALDCLNNSLNHTQIVPALYLNFPGKQQVLIPHYMLPYQNYPFYPIKKTRQQRNQLFTGNGSLSSVFNSGQQTKKAAHQDNHEQMKNVLVHYRKLGLNKEEFIQKQQLLDVITFLTDNLQSKANIKLVELFIQFLVSYIKSEINNQGALVNIPIVFRQEIATQMALKTYALIHSKPSKFPNRGLFQAKSAELIYILHSISSDPYYIYSLGLDVIWKNPNFWNFDPDQDDKNIQRLLKCTDLVVRLAIKHYSSQKSVNIPNLMETIAQIFTANCYHFIKKIHKFNAIFGILLNLILLKVKPEQMFDFLFVLITQKLIKAELQSEVFGNEDQQQKTVQIPSLAASQLLGQAFYLFLVNIYRSPECLNSEKNFRLLDIFVEYLHHYINAHKIVIQVGQIFGKVLCCCICIMQQLFVSLTLANYDKSKLEFLWRNILYSGKIYKTDLQKKILSIKLLNLVRQTIRRNDPSFDLKRVENMFQLVCSCIFYSKNKDTLMSQEEEDYDDFDHVGEEEEWENSPITLNRNQTDVYIQDDVLLLKTICRELLESPVLEIKKWATNVIQSLPVAVRNFVKNKVINYEQQAKEVGLRKIVKVKRLQDNEGSNKKKQILNTNISNRVSEVQEDHHE